MSSKTKTITRVRYTWKAGSRFSVPAEVVAKSMQQIEKENSGSVTPAIVVNYARSPSSALHPLFNWNDDEAAELYRQNQARKVINSIRVIDLSDRSPKPSQRILYVSVQATEEERAYRDSRIVMSESSTRDMILEEALRSLEGWIRRYNHFQELDSLLNHVEQVKTELVSKRKVRKKIS